MKKIFMGLFGLGILHLSYGQLQHTAYVGGLGGGVLNGGSFQSIGVVGDPAGTTDLANNSDFTVYPGFVAGTTIVFSFGLAKDSAVLAVLYQALGGDLWSDNSGWLQSADIQSWAGVTLGDQRVVGLSLANNNLQNSVPDIILNLNKLDSVDFSGNELVGLPDMSQMPMLSKLHVAENRLGFESLVGNKTIESFEYAPQQRVGVGREDTVKADSTWVLLAAISGTGNKYQWVFEHVEGAGEVAIAGATDSELTLSGLSFANMGTYRLTATNDSLPGLVIESENQNIWVSTDIQGTVLADDQGTPLADGQVEVYRIFDGPFEKSDSAQLATDGSYLMENVVLGDFILLVRHNPQTFPNVVQTYFVSTDDWREADTLYLREAASAIDISMVFKPEELPPLETGATFNGLIETDFEEPAERAATRINARRKVKRAACSVRRFVPRGRTAQDEDGIYELYAYVESDDNGNFSFTDIEEGTYRLNIQYPGVPMDEDSDIEIIVSGSEENQLFDIRATVTEEGIVVETTKVLWTNKPFLKNVRLYPIPTDGMVLAKFEIYRKLEELFVEVRDMKGVLLMREELSARVGYQEVGIDLTAYKSGMYFVEFTDGDGVFKQHMKVVKK